MPKDEWIDKLAGRAGVAPDEAKAVLDALSEMDRRRERSGRPLPIEAVGPGPNDGWQRRARKPLSYQPTSAEVGRLIEDAQRHPLGLQFLIEGELGSVAVTFGVHAFTVDAARRRLGAAQD